MRDVNFVRRTDHSRASMARRAVVQLVCSTVLAFGLISWGPAFAGENNCDGFGDIADLHGRTGVGVANTPEDPVHPWQDALTVQGGDLKAPRDLLRYAGKPVVVMGARFKGADFSGLKLADVCFVDSDLSGSRWGGVKSIALAFNNVDLSKANLAGASLVAAQFQSSNLEGANAEGADLSRSILSDNRVDQLDLRGGDLRGARINADSFPYRDFGQPEPSVDAENTHMEGTIFGEKDLDGWRFDGASMDGADVPFDQLAIFKGGSLKTSITIGDSFGAHGVASLSKVEWSQLQKALASGPERSGGGSPPPRLRPGGEALFGSADLPVPAWFRSTALYGKVEPVIWGSSSSKLYVKMLGRRRIRASGLAMKSNGDECNLDNQVYLLEPGTEWYGTPPIRGKTRFWRRAVRLHGPVAEVVGAADCLSAGFTDMRRLPLGPSMHAILSEATQGLDQKP